jgi:hypothetical protein
MTIKIFGQYSDDTGKNVKASSSDFALKQQMSFNTIS